MSISLTCVMIGLLSGYVQEGDSPKPAPASEVAAEKKVAEKGDKVTRGAEVDRWEKKRERPALEELIEEVGIDNVKIEYAKPFRDKLEGDVKKKAVQAMVEAEFDQRLNEATKKIEGLRLRLLKAESALAEQKENRKAFIDKRVEELLAEVEGGDKGFNVLNGDEFKDSLSPAKIESTRVEDLADASKPRKGDPLSDLTVGSSDLADALSVLKSNTMFDTPYPVRDGSREHTFETLRGRAYQLKSKLEYGLKSVPMDPKRSRRQEYMYYKRAIEDLVWDGDLFLEQTRTSCKLVELQLNGLTEVHKIEAKELANQETLLAHNAASARTVDLARIAVHKLETELNLKKAIVETFKKQMSLISSERAKIRDLFEKLKFKIGSTEPEVTQW